MHAYVCQDDFGFWFTTVENDSGDLYVVAHAGTKAHAEDEAREQAGDNVTVQSPPHIDFPPGGIAPGYQPPEPRRCQ